MVSSKLFEGERMNDVFVNMATNNHGNGFYRTSLFSYGILSDDKAVRFDRLFSQSFYFLL